MTREELLGRGYREYPPTRFHSGFVENCFQRRCTDNRGTKYFINVKQWEPLPGMPDPLYSYDMQLYAARTHDAVDMEFHSSWTLDAVEKYAAALFATGLFDYYELYEDDE